ncbi:hypothetical protein HH310_37500 [Actinoplanes sp. TBRC 11911]|uniref:hypothetical protein n=1 Tax=Actinoplanes sp. TBRC 11911 TaxID=2729386 RepID=UPI00145F884D|nr:hypothetical protein [Actinoplanes sp. TBRC 11911]NMO56856.1 hypothetical protein [Actinoplanes sp. TBRC 11911]
MDAESHSWVFDLVATDDVVRHRALNRHRALLAAAAEALTWSNRIWAQAGTPAPTEPHLAAEMDQAQADFRWHREQTILGPITAEADEFLVLFLRWETDYPEEWKAPGSWMWSPWTTKEVILRRLDRGGVPEQIRPPIGDLIVSAVQRPYRCKDWMYAPLVRHVLDTSFAGRIEALRDADDPLVRLRAQFLLHVAEHPENPVRRASWRRWLSSDTGIM